jgi:NADH:ubiquinone oxidoreductase subunit 3 (subunit A)
MLYNYVALLLFIAFAVFVPVSFLLTAKLLGRKESGNPVKNAPYESGEKTVGDSRDVDNEYLPYFMLFLPFEIVIAILVLWSTTARQMSLSANIMLIGLGLFATVASFVGYRMVRHVVVR